MPRARRFLVLAFACAASAAALAAQTAAEIEALVREGKLDEAIAAGRAAVAEAPGDPDRRVALAHALQAKGRTARKVVDVAVGAEELRSGGLKLPRLGPGTPTRTEVRYDAQLLGEALRSLQEAERLAPGRKDVVLKRCYLLADSGDVSGAKEAVGRAAAAFPADPTLAETLAALGAVRVEAGDPAGGAAILGAVAKAFPSSAPVHADWGYVLAQAGKKAEGLAALDRAADLAPNDLAILRRRATAAMLVRDFARARSAYRASAKTSGDPIDLLGAAAAAIASDLAAAKSELAGLARPEGAPPPVAEAAADLLKAASRGPAERGNLDQAETLVRDGMEILALPILHRALRASPADSRAAEILAGIYRGFGFRSLADETKRAAQPPAKTAKGTSR